MSHRHSRCPAGKQLAPYRKMLAHPLRGHLEGGLVGVADTCVRDHDVKAPYHPLDFLDGCFVGLLICGDDFDYMDAVGMRSRESIEITGAGGVTSAGKDDSIGAAGKRSDNSKTWRMLK